MNYRFVLTMILLIGFVFGGCSTPEETKGGDTDVQYTPAPLKANDKTDQQVANQVKQILDQFDEIQTIKAVNSPKTILAAVEIDHNKRIKLEKLEKKYRQAIMDQFPDKIIELSTDKKLVIEIDRLEESIKNKDISQKSLEIKMQKLIKLMNKTT